MLTRGSRLGPYEIVSALGEGGMGEVYRARDSRLDRTVALKVLSAKLDATPELQARFEREARAIAALQHPNICVLHDLGREGTTSFLVMEYLEGETLAARLRRGPLPLPEVVALGAQIASALDRAHRAGIVHRDLKPANIMLVKSGGQIQAKLLDFGLAKASISSSIVPTIHEAATQAGAVLGTIPYMAPEQLEGREADVRSDIYAFGCVLYEMATAEPAFKGVRPLQPSSLNRLVQACLAPNPGDRLQSAHDAALMLAGVGDAAPAPPARSPRRRVLILAWVTALLVIAAVVAWILHPTPARPAPTFTEIVPPPGWHFNFGGSFPSPPVISPNGRQVVFAAANPSGRTALWLRPLDSMQAQELPGTQDAVYPFWSPDSASLGYFTQPGPFGGGNLMILSLAGGLPHPLAPVLTSRGGAWAKDGTILFASDVTGGLLRISAQGGTPLPVSGCDVHLYSSCRFPYFLPDGQHFLYMAISHGDTSTDMLFEASLDGSMNRPLLHSLSAGIFAAGKLLYSSAGTLMAQTLDPATGALRGSPQPVAAGVFDDLITWRAAYSASMTGTLVYAAGSSGAQQLGWVGRDGKLLTMLPGFGGQAVTAAVSPDGKLVAISLDQGMQDIWTQPVTGGPLSRLTFGPVANLHPVWSPSGAAIAYFGGPAGAGAIAQRPSRGGPEQVLMAHPKGAATGSPLHPVGWSPDGRELLCASVHEIAALDVTQGRLRQLLATRSDLIRSAALSPDGRWVSDLSGPPGQPANVNVFPFRGSPSTRWQVTTAGAVNQFWVQGGRELDIVDTDGRLLAIPVSISGDTPVFGPPHLLATNFPPVQAATPDGQRFLATFWPNDHQRLVVVSSWLPRP